MSFPTTASFVPGAIEVPPPSLILSFPLSIPLCFRLPSSFDAPTKLFYPVIYRVTNGVPRGLYSRVAVTPLASSPWPAHAIYLSRLRDSIPPSRRLPPPSPPSAPFFAPASVPFRCSRQRAVASFVRLRSSPFPRSALGVDVSSGHIFVTRPRTARLESSSETVRVNLRKSIPLRSFDVDVSAPIQPEFRIIPLERERERPILLLLLYRGAFRAIDLTSRRHDFAISSRAMPIVNFIHKFLNEHAR